MPEQQNITNIPSNRVEFIDSRTGMVSREWYRFFLNLFNLAGGGGNQTSLDDLQLAPPPSADGGGGGGTGTVTSVDVNGGTTGLTTSGGPITTSGTITLAGTLGIANGGTGGTTATSGRTNLGAAASGANGDITSMTGITGGISTPDFVQFDTAYVTPLTAGQLGWDGNNTLGIGMAGGNVIQHIGEDQFFYCKATSGITKGQVVMFTGAVGASGVPTGAPATGITDGTYIMGVAAEDIALNGFGLVQSFGTLRNINTSGYADGDVLWYDPAVAGGLTKTKPSAPNVKVQMAAVINGGSAGGGTILIRINPGSTLGGTDSNAQISSPSNGDLIQYDSTLQYWKNVPGTTFVSSVTGTSPIASSGGSTPAISLSANYGDTLNPYASKTANYFLAAPDGLAGAPTFRAIVAADIPTLNQNTTGTASNVTGTVAIGNGGTGQTTKLAAFDALSPTTTKGDLIVSNGTNNIRLGVGTDTYVLTADSTAASGIKWAAASGGGSNITSQGLWENNATISANYTIATGNNAMSAGPITINSGVVVTVPSGSTWVVA